MWTPGGMDGIRKRIDQLCTNHVVDVVELADTVRARNPAAVSSRLADSKSGCGQGHWCMQESPSEVNEGMLRFLAGLPDSIKRAAARETPTTKL